MLSGTHGQTGNATAARLILVSRTYFTSLSSDHQLLFLPCAKQLQNLRGPSGSGLSQESPMGDA